VVPVPSTSNRLKTWSPATGWGSTRGEITNFIVSEKSKDAWVVSKNESQKKKEAARSLRRSPSVASTRTAQALLQNLEGDGQAQLEQVTVTDAHLRSSTETGVHETESGPILAFLSTQGSAGENNELSRAIENNEREGSVSPASPGDDDDTHVDVSLKTKRSRADGQQARTVFVFVPSGGGGQPVKIIKQADVTSAAIFYAHARAAFRIPAHEEDVVLEVGFGEFEEAL
jgi:hypothetical protein